MSLLRARLDQFPRLYGRLRTRAYVQIVLGAIGLVVSAFLGFLGLLLAVMPDGGLWEKRSSYVVGFLGGVLPLVGSALAIWRGVVGRSRAHTARDIVALSRLTPVFGSRDVAQHLGLRPMEAERAVLEALAYGFLEEVPGTADLAASGAAMLPSVSATFPTAGAHLGPTSPAHLAAQNASLQSGTLQNASLQAGQRPNVARALADTPVVITPPSPLAGSTTVQAPHTPRHAGPSSPPPASAAALVGSVLNGTYQIERHLGSGGMGAVYEARHLRTGRKYAVKTLLPDAQLSPDAIRRFEREATAASALGHPGIVAVHDFHSTDDGLFYMVMDLLEGETLDQRLERTGSLPWPEARRIVLEAGEALAAAHDKGILHRDLKPANLFLAKVPGEPRERLILLDFGLAKPIDSGAVSRLTSTGAAVGTPLYMAPEQARGEPVDVRCDVYGLGAVLHEMLTGAPPFFDRTLAAVYARLLTESAPSAVRAAPHPVPPIVDDLLACALAKAPKDRFDTVRAFLAAIANVPSSPAVQMTG